jgi:hypothetical protein
MVFQRVFKVVYASEILADGVSRRRERRNASDVTGVIQMPRQQAPQGYGLPPVYAYLKTVYRFEFSEEQIPHAVKCIFAISPAVFIEILPVFDELPWQMLVKVVVHNFIDFIPGQSLVEDLRE